MKMTFRIGDALVYLFILLLIAGSFAGLYQLKRICYQSRCSGNRRQGGELVISRAGRSVHIMPAAIATIYASPNRVMIREANCPDQICVTREISADRGRPSFLLTRWLSE